MSSARDALCHEAQQLVDLMTPDGANISTIISENPQLAVGLTDYMSYRDEINRHIAEQGEQKQTGHSISDALRDLRSPK